MLLLANLGRLSLCCSRRDKQTKHARKTLVKTSYRTFHHSETIRMFPLNPRSSNTSSITITQLTLSSHLATILTPVAPGNVLPSSRLRPRVAGDAGSNLNHPWTLHLTMKVCPHLWFGSPRLPYIVKWAELCEATRGNRESRAILW